MFCGVAVEVVEGGELAGAGLDDVPGLVQQLADVADVRVDGLGPDAEQGGDVLLGQAVAVVQGCGGELAGEGEQGAAAGAGGYLAGPVAAAAVQAGFAGLVAGGCQGGGQGVRAAGGQAGQGPVG
jgi:hypothetical protein